MYNIYVLYDDRNQGIGGNKKVINTMQKNFLGKEIEWEERKKEKG